MAQRCSAYLILHAIKMPQRSGCCRRANTGAEISAETGSIPVLPMIGQLLLHYRVVEKIGEGGQGTVYKVIDTTLDRPAVIKVCRRISLTALPTSSFRTRSQAASSLDHPNICTIFGLHKVGDVQFIAMQYVEGRNVREIVDGQPLDLRRALSIAIQVTDALAAAHAAASCIATSKRAT